MKSIKSIFISTYIVFLVLSFSVLGYNLISGQIAEIYFFAAFLSSVGPILYFLFLYLKRPKDVSFLGILIFTFCAVSTLIAIGFYFTEGSEYKFPMIFACFNFIGWLLYYIWYTNNTIPKSDTLSKEIKQLGSLEPLLKSDGINSTLVLYINNTSYPFDIRQFTDFRDEIELYKKENTRIVFVVSDSDSVKSSHPYIHIADNASGEYSKNTYIERPDKAPFFIGKKISGQYYSIPLGILFDKSGEIRFIHTSADDRKRPNPEFFLRIIREF